MSELTIVLLLGAGTVLWTLGGMGWKGWRRIVWPIALSFLLFHSVGAVKAGLVGLTTFAVATLPYGEKTAWPLRVAVYASYGLPGIWLHADRVWFPVVLCVGLLSGLTMLSKKLNWVTWKVVEGLAGFLNAAGVVLTGV